jgi:hypothetical protein
MRRDVVNFEEKEEMQDPKTEDTSNAHVTSAAGSEDSATTVTLADECPASYLTKRYKNDCSKVRNVHDTGVANQAGVVLIFRLPLGAASRRCLPASTFDGGGISGEQRDIDNRRLREEWIYCVWFPTQASSPWKLLQLEAEAATAKRRTAREQITKCFLIISCYNTNSHGAQFSSGFGSAATAPLVHFPGFSHARRLCANFPAESMST